MPSSSAVQTANFPAAEVEEFLAASCAPGKADDAALLDVKQGG